MRLLRSVGDKNMKQYLIVIETGKNNCSAYCPDVPGCIAAGKTVEETLHQMKQALCFHFEGLAQQDEPIPKPRGLGYHMEEIDAEKGDFFTFVSVSMPVLETAA